ncbi:MAG: PEGA domain-containing protein [Acidobacteriota bacterium]
MKIERLALTVSALAVTAALAAPAAEAREPLRPRGSEPVTSSKSAAPAAAEVSNSADRRGGTRYRADRGDRSRARHSDRHRARSRDRHRAHRGSYRGYGSSYRKYGRSYRHRSWPSVRFGVGYGYPYYRPYRYGYHYRPYIYASYGPWSVVPWYWPRTSVVVDARSRGYGYGGRLVGAFDLDVRPEEAEIYVDGDYLGTADDFDGFPEYLWLEEGTYDLSIYLPGYETLTRQYTVRPGVVIDVNDRLRQGESIHPDDLGPTSTERREARLEADHEKRVRAEERVDFRAKFEGSRLHVTISPEDAAVYLNGQFVGTGGELTGLPRGLRVEPGQHTIEVTRPGFASEERQITVAAGEKFELELELQSR